jgi:hypothetical protein
MRCSPEEEHLIQSVGEVGKQSHLTRTLDSGGQLTLMLCAGAGNAAGKDLSTLGDELAKLSCVLVIDHFDLIGTELANLLLSAHGAERMLGIVSIHFKSFLSFI